jgi:DNA-binding LytR/AlgR family response regulator
MKGLIIEDETAAARNLKAILGDVAPEVEVLAVLDSIHKSVAWLTANSHPDVIFMDIHLSDGDSFHIFRLVDVLSPIIFTTAYDEYAIQAFKVNSIDYLLKPIDPEEVAVALEKLRKLKTKVDPDYTSLIPEILKGNMYQKTLLAFYQNRIIPLETNKIAFFQSMNEKVTAYSFLGEAYPVEKALNSLMSILDPEQFFRANRQFLVSRKLIKEVLLWDGGRLLIVPSLAINEQIIISKERVAWFKNWLQHLH